MTVLDVVSQYHGTDAVFQRYDVRAGECICCCCLFETLEGLCQKYGFDLEILVDELARTAVLSIPPEPGQ
jgi:hypothetical protein